MRVLLIEDDPEIANRLSEGLDAAGFTVERADNGADGYVMGTEEQYDAVVLDLGLPQMSGLDALRKWRAGSFKMPVLILTARGSWAEKVDGLNAGADDYITKPFHIPEVVARLNALIRRSAGLASPTLTHKGITLDATAGKAMLDGQPIELTAKELRMLNYFMHRIGRIVSQAELTEHLYSLEGTRESNTIEVYVSRLRRKFGADVIKTIRGLGYRMD
ncbi:response regulator transcription factor [Hyphomicrobium sp. CS1GBMeth3]|uniref:response regulator transcription factor n=1 Tax=Hyphomicrobium sp. CS1GBMeth3 TaxID=1892845 RepID=UPI0009301081|nr:response regulator transcription factor [Hyphomicrobium sp. CS1GBMeth3]